MLLIFLAVAWLIGIILADIFALPLLPLVAIAAVCSALAGCFWRLPRARLVLLVIVCIACGGIRLATSGVPTTPRSVWLLNDIGKLTLEGVVVEDPKRTEEGQRVLIAAERVATEGGWRKAEGFVLVTLPPYPERRYGDRLRFQGSLKMPRAAERPSQFDYRQYLARKGIFSLMQPNTTVHVSANNANPALAWLLNVRDRARDVLLRELPEPQSSLAVGILLGLQSSIPDDVYTTFSATGTSHILVISGWNITIIATALYSLASRLRLSKGTAFWAILGTIWIYVLFVGASPTVIRAAVMGSIVALAQCLDRRAHAWTTLFVACWAMTLLNPQTLWDLGFQLSALATASLFAFGKGTEVMLNHTFLRAGWLDWAREALTATLAAQILALPLILYQFGNLSIIAPLANVALLPVVPYAMLFGGIALLGGMVSLSVGQWLALPAYAFLSWLTKGADLFANLPYAAVQIPPFPLWVLLAYYAIVVGTWLWNKPYHDLSAAGEGESLG